MINRDLIVDQNISENDIVTLNELKGVCERSVFQPNQRNRIVIAKSMEPGVRNMSNPDYGHASNILES